MKKFLLTMLMAGLLGTNAWAQLVLPDPDLVLAPGETIATKHEDFYAYSALINDIVYPDDGWDFSTGTGGLDVLIYTGAQGANNQGVGLDDAFDFEDPMTAPTGVGSDVFSGTWGLGDQDNGPVTVDNLYAYLTTTFGPEITVPVFYFDQNQIGPDPDLYIAARVSIWDPEAEKIVAEWIFDGIENGLFDIPDLTDITDPAWILSDGELTIDGVGTVDHNLGSGKADYIAIAPTMDLTPYVGFEYLFRADFYMANLNNGFEELFLTGAIALPSCPDGNCGSVVPEPASMVLLGSGLVGMIAYRRRKVS